MKFALFKYFQIFYSYTGFSILWLLLIILLSGFMDSIGIILFIPMINAVLNNQITEGSNETLGITVNKVFSYIGVNPTFLSVVIIAISVFLLKAIVKIGQSVYSQHIIEQTRKELRLKTLKKYALLDYSFIIKYDIGYLTNMVVNEITKSMLALTTYIMVLVAIIYSILYFTLAFYLDYTITITLFILCLLLYSGIHYANKYAKLLSIENSSVDAKLQKTVIQYIEAYKFLKATFGFDRLMPLITKLAERAMWIQVRIKSIGAIITSISEPIGIALALTVIYYRTQIQGISFAESIVLVMFIKKVFQYAMEFQQSWHRFNAQVGGVLALSDLNHSMHNNFEKNGNIPFDSIGKSVRFDRLSVEINGALILNEMSLEIQKNSCVAFVGRSGAGKTTLSNMLPGLYKPSSGDVSINNKKLEEIDLISLRKKVGYVSQEPIIFNDTIFSNVSMWDHTYSPEERARRINKALELAHCDFIAELPGGVETVLGDRGVMLSGGQRQRIAIARELYKEPEILIFDEATSSLDFESEQKIQQSIDELHGKLTMVIIAHRLSSVHNCDTIYVLDKGKIIEQGSFRSLSKKQGSLFTKLYKTQNI